MNACQKLDRAGAGARAMGILEGHSVLCSQFWPDPACPRAAPILDPRLVAPTDLAEASASWDATCGPFSLAAALRRQVADVRALFPQFKGYTNPTTMAVALRMAGTLPIKTLCDHWPMYGIAFVQIKGPWCKPGVPIGAAYTRMHCVAVQTCADGRWVYDCNADRWLPDGRWQAEMLPVVIGMYKGANGGWGIRTGFSFDDPLDKGAHR